jgi:hypothetical protein
MNVSHSVIQVQFQLIKNVSLVNKIASNVTKIYGVQIVNHHIFLKTEFVSLNVELIFFKMS